MNWGKYLSGWKTYVGAGFVIANVILVVAGKEEIAKAVFSLGVALGFIGLRHHGARMVIQHKANNIMDDIASGTVDIPKKEDLLKDDTAFNH